VLAFSTVEEAVNAIDQLASDRDRHAVAASEIAEQYFDSDKVLTHLIDEAFSIDHPT
jgi:hypothetical protein